MSRQLTALFTCVALLATACAPSDSSDGTSTTASEGTTETGVDVEPEDIHFAYLAGYLAVPMEEVSATEEQLNAAGVEFAAAEISDVLESDEEQPDDEVAEDEILAARGTLAEMIQIYTVTEDPWQVSMEIRESAEGLHIAPIHAMGEAGHAGYQSGTDPDPRDGQSIDPTNAAAESADLAAVVDSGIYPEAPWLEGSVEFQGGFDLERGQAVHSHGTFVSGIVRQLSPDHRITFARARRVPLIELAWDDGAVGPTNLTELSTEIHVAEAILRLIHRHQREPARVKSLTLALGGYSMTPEQDSWMTITALAIDRWLREFPEAPVFAAAGNATSLQTFSPAALEAVIGVGALDDPSNGEPVEIVWDENHGEIPWSDLSSNDRQSSDDLAPGSQLAQYTQPDLVACWSGSSFAAALATGLYLRGESPIPPRRADVGGLSYCVGQDVVTNSS